MAWVFLNRQVLNLSNINWPKKGSPFITAVFLHLFYNTLTLKSVQLSALKQQRKILDCNGQKNVVFGKVAQNNIKGKYFQMWLVHTSHWRICAELRVHTNGPVLICNERVKEKLLSPTLSAASYWKKQTNKQKLISSLSNWFM